MRRRTKFRGSTKKIEVSSFFDEKQGGILPLNTPYTLPLLRHLYPSGKPGVPPKKHTFRDTTKTWDFPYKPPMKRGKTRCALEPLPGWHDFVAKLWVKQLTRERFRVTIWVPKTVCRNPDKKGQK